MENVRNGHAEKPKCGPIEGGTGTVVCTDSSCRTCHPLPPEGEWERQIQDLAQMHDDCCVFFGVGTPRTACDCELQKMVSAFIRKEKELSYGEGYGKGHADGQIAAKGFFLSDVLEAKENGFKEGRERGLREARKAVDDAIPYYEQIGDREYNQDCENNNARRADALEAIDRLLSGGKEGKDV